jgi:hypothetical protein
LQSIVCYRLCAPWSLGLFGDHDSYRADILAPHRGPYRVHTSIFDTVRVQAAPNCYCGTLDRGDSDVSLVPPRHPVPNGAQSCHTREVRGKDLLAKLRQHCVATAFRLSQSFTVPTYVNMSYVAALQLPRQILTSSSMTGQCTHAATQLTVFDHEHSYTRPRLASPHNNHHHTR